MSTLAQFWGYWYFGYTPHMGQNWPLLLDFLVRYCTTYLQPHCVQKSFQKCQVSDPALLIWVFCILYILLIYRRISILIQMQNLPLFWNFFTSHGIFKMTHHHTRSHSNAPTTVSVGHNITVPHTEEGYSNEPHCIEQICMFLIVISVLSDFFCNFFQTPLGVGLSFVFRT